MPRISRFTRRKAESAWAHATSTASARFHARKKLESLLNRQIRQPLNADPINEQDAVAGQPLGIAHHGKGRRQPRHDGRVLTANRRTDAVSAPITHDEIPMDRGRLPPSSDVLEPLPGTTQPVSGIAGARPFASSGKV